MKTTVIRSRRWLMAALVIAWPTAAAAVGFEIDLHVGRAMPTFEQTLSFAAAGAIPQVPGVTVRSLGPLALDARGALAYSGSATLFLAGPLGIEGRIDSLEADLESQPAGYEITVARPPLPFFGARLDLGGQDLKLERVQPVSLNLRLVTPGPVRLSISGGVSRLGALKLGGTLGGTLRASGVSLPLPSAQVRLAAVAPPEEAERGQYGLNAGAAIQIGGAVALSVEARGFIFKERVLTWSALGAPANVVEEALQRELLARLEPLRFKPTFFSVNAGLALRF